MNQLDQAFFEIAETMAKAWGGITEAWNEFVNWFYPHFWRNNLVMAVALIVLVIVAKR